MGYESEQVKVNVQSQCPTTYTCVCKLAALCLCSVPPPPKWTRVREASSSLLEEAVRYVYLNNRKRAMNIK